MASFAAHVTKGLIHDRTVRRKIMFVLLLVALLLLICGWTFLHSVINPREHPVRFICYWLACGWFALTAMLLAIFDLLVAKLESRRAARQLREKLGGSDYTRTSD